MYAYQAVYNRRLRDWHYVHVYGVSTRVSMDGPTQQSASSQSSTCFAAEAAVWSFATVAEAVAATATLTTNIFMLQMSMES